MRATTRLPAWLMIVILLVLFTSCRKAHQQQASPSASTTTTATATLRVLLSEYPTFMEGFDFGVRIQSEDGVVLGERSVGAGNFTKVSESPVEWATDVEVPMGPLVVQADLQVSAGGPISKPTFDSPSTCQIKVDARSGMTILRLDWESGCLGT